MALVLAGCATHSGNSAWREGTTTITVTGTEGSSITGYYVQDGHRRPINGTLPYTLKEIGLSTIEIRKAQLEEAFTFHAEYDSPVRKFSAANLVAGPGVKGVRMELRNGYSVEHIR